MNPRRITVGDIRHALKDVPDDVEVLFNVEENDNHNWDTFDVTVDNSSYMCNGDPGCTHTEPEMLWDIVFFVRDPSLGDRSITARIGGKQPGDNE